MTIRDYQVHEVGDQLFRKLTQPAAGGKVGDPGLVGDRPCVLLTDQDANGFATVKFNGSYRLTVKGEGAAAANTALAVNSPVFYDAAATPKINGDTAAVRFGTLIDAVASGATVTAVVDLHG